MRVLIDYNNDGDFNDANESLFTAFDDTASKKITIPITGVVLNTPLRMRVMADEPTKTPTACQLNGTATLGSGQAEDYTVIVVSAVNIIAYKKNHSKPLNDEIAKAN